MELRTISASSLTSYQECPARWHAENVKRTPRTGGAGPAGVGTACHYALEKYVIEAYVEGTKPPHLNVLLAHYEIGFADTFGTFDKTSDEFKDGKEMLERWWNRTDLDGIEILSTEKKDFMPIKTSDGVKKYNYIWDRCDLLRENGKLIIRVVDYKSIRANLSPDDLREKIQARMYAMAAAFQFKDIEPDEIWIMFDLLRYGTVEVKFTREENLETWKFVKKTAEKILATPDTDIPETLGPGCMFCVRKTTCMTLRKNISGGGIMSLAADMDDLAEARMQLEGVHKASKYALEEIDKLMYEKAKELDEIEYSSERFNVKLIASRRSYWDADDVAEIIGPEMFSEIGSVTNAAVERLIKGGELSDIQKSLLAQRKREKFGDMKPKVVKKA